MNNLSEMIEENDNLIRRCIDAQTNAHEHKQKISPVTQHCQCNGLYEKNKVFGCGSKF